MLRPRFSSVTSTYRHRPTRQPPNKATTHSTSHIAWSRRRAGVYLEHFHFQSLDENKPLINKIVNLRAKRKFPRGSKKSNLLMLEGVLLTRVWKIACFLLAYGELGKKRPKMLSQICAHVPTQAEMPWHGECMI